MNEIIPHLFLGDWKAAHDSEWVRQHNITSFLNLTERESSNTNSFHFPVKDLPLTGMSWVSKPIQFVDAEIKRQKNILIHCQQGVSRSVACVLYYLMTRHDMSLFDAFHLVKGKRPQICPSIGFMQDLSELESHVSFPSERYTKYVLQERFPLRSKEEIDAVYQESVDSLTNERKEELFHSIGTNNIEPIGYTCIDILMSRYPDEFVRQARYTNHHPFD